MIYDPSCISSSQEKWNLKAIKGAPNPCFEDSQHSEVADKSKTVI